MTCGEVSWAGCGGIGDIGIGTWVWCSAVAQQPWGPMADFPWCWAARWCSNHGLGRQWYWHLGVVQCGGAATPDAKADYSWCWAARWRSNHEWWRHWNMGTNSRMWCGAVAQQLWRLASAGTL